MKTTFAIALFFCLAFTDAKASGQFMLQRFRATKIPEIKALGPKNLAGSYVSLFYVSGREAAIGTQGKKLVAHKILQGPVHKTIASDGTIAFDAAEIPKIGWSMVNYIYLVVHKQPRFFIENPNGTRPEDGRVENDPTGWDSVLEDEFESVSKYYHKFEEGNRPTEASIQMDLRI